MRMRKKKETNSAKKKSGAVSAKDPKKDFFLHVETSRTYKEDMVRIFVRN